MILSRNQLLSKVFIESISKIPDTLKRSLYIKQYSSILELDESILHKESNDLIKGEQKKNSYRSYRNENYAEGTNAYAKGPSEKQGSIKTRNYDSDEYQERELVRVLINFGNLSIYLEEDLKVCEFIFENTTDILDNFDNILYLNVLKLSYEAFQSGTKQNSIRISTSIMQILRFNHWQLT